MKRSNIFLSSGFMILLLLMANSICLVQADKWTKKADMPTARYCSACEVNGKIYAIGGSHWNGVFITVEEYDPATDKWTRKADMPTARYCLSACVLNGKIYAAGGVSWGAPLSAFEEYDPAKDKWTKKADMPTQRYGLCLSPINGKIYAIGGSLDTNWNPGRVVEEYDPIKDVWTKKPDMPNARFFADSSAVYNKIYVIGGIFDSELVQEYDPLIDKWIQKANIPTKRYQLSTCVVSNRIYAIGGRDDMGGAPNALSSVEEYDPSTNKWTIKGKMPTARFIVSSASVKGKIYAIGGAQNFAVALSTVEEYDTGLAFQSVEPSNKLTTSWGRIRHFDVLPRLKSRDSGVKRR